MTDDYITVMRELSVILLKPIYGGVNWNLLSRSICQHLT